MLKKHKPDCKHDRTQWTGPRAFQGQVAESPERVNRAAHGGAEWVETCLVCGAVRRVNSNAGDEYGPWVLPAGKGAA